MAKDDNLKQLAEMMKSRPGLAASPVPELDIPDKVPFKERVYVCKDCGKKYSPITIAQKYCMDCVPRHYPAAKCAMCGKEFVRYPTRRIYCPDCRGQRPKKTPVDRSGEVTCAVCKKVFMAKNAQSAKYCPECRDLSRSKKRRAGALDVKSDNHKMVKMRCQHCECIFQTTWELYRKGRKYCSNACRDEASKKKAGKKYEPTPAEDKPLEVADVEYVPHPGQLLFHNSKARFRVLRCLPPGELILGTNKNIEKLQVGDSVFGNNGEVNQVHDTLSRDYQGNVYKINARYILPFQVTDEHPILVAKAVRNDNYEAYIKGRREKKTIWSIGEEKWVEARELGGYLKENDRYNRWCLKIPRLKAGADIAGWGLRELQNKKAYYKESFPINTETAWLMGLFIAEGSTGDGVVQIHLGSHEIYLKNKAVEILQKLGYTPSINNREVLHTTSIVICSIALCELFIEKFGVRAHNKQIPNDLLLHPNRQIILSLLKGYFDGDGSLNVLTKKLMATTVSKKLALQLQLITARLGFTALLHKGSKKESKIQGRSIKSGDFYTVVINSYKLINEMGYEVDKKICREYSFVKDEAVYVPITDIKPIPYSGMVYNISTTDETFLVSNIVSHNCANRWGKDRASIMEFMKLFVEMLSENRPATLVPRVMGWIVAPTYDLAKQNWMELKSFFPEQWIVGRPNEAERRIKTIRDGIIEVKSADNPESLVAVGLDIVLMTEAARAKNLETTWGNIFARLSSHERGPGGKGGVGIFNSTPLGRGFFHTMCHWGQDPLRPEWESWHFDCYSSPYISKESIEIAKRDTSERLFRQNWLAEFLEDGGEVFANIDLLSTSQIEDPLPYMAYKAAWDPAQRSDLSVFGIRDQYGKQVYKRVFTGMLYEDQLDIIEVQCVRYNYAPLDIDMTSGGETLPREAQKRGLQANGIYWSGGGNVKHGMVSHLCVLMEKKSITLLDDEQQKDELKSYTYNITANGYVQYSAPRGENDDHVSMLIMLYHDFDAAVVTRPWMGRYGCIPHKKGSGQMVATPNNRVVDRPHVQPLKSTSDIMLKMCIAQGYVPPTCELPGVIVFGLINKGEDPCAGCNGNRGICQGRPKR